MIKFIKKRDGRVEEFNPKKIAMAIIAAMKKFNIEDLEVAGNIADEISAMDLNVIDIEEVQDMVEFKLMKSDYKQVAKEYITYREKRSNIRSANSKLNKKIEDILMCKSIENSNANLDEHSFAGRKNESANALQKDLALNVFMRPEVAQAHRENRVYTHDLCEYNVGGHNCTFLNLGDILARGFKTRNGDIRPASRFSTACQQIAVIFQVHSQSQYGGISSPHIDFDLAPFVKKSFFKHYEDGLKYVEQDEEKTWTDFLAIYIITFPVHRKSIEGFSNLKKAINSVLLKNYSIESEIFKTYSNSAYKYAIDMLEKEGLQSAEALYHNLNSLESRPGSQLPFTSINFGRDTSPEGRKVIEWLLKANLAGIGEYHQTPIFPISVFQHKKGINDKPGTPNYDLKLLAIKALSSHIYPNIVNGDWSQNIEDPDNPSTYMATMGCVDGKEGIVYEINNKSLFMEGFETAWNRLSKIFDIKYYDYSNYMDLENVTVYDTSSNKFVNAFKIIKNPDVGNWRQLLFEDGSILLATDDHALPIKDKGRVLVKDMEIWDEVRKQNSMGTEPVPPEYVTCIDIKDLGFRNKPSYCLETESGRFDISNINSYNCRTFIGYDRHGLGHSKTGRGNAAPVTINLPKIGIKHGICLKEREKPDIDGFFEELDEVLKLAETALIDRFYQICKQSVKSGFFMYDNNTLADADNAMKNGIYETMRHFTLAIGFIGIAEACRALYGIDHSYGVKEVDDFAEKVIKTIHEYAKDASERNNLNFGCYSTP